MNDKSIWNSIDRTGTVPQNDTVANIVAILSFLKERAPEVGVTRNSLAINDIHDGTGIPESSVYRYMRKLLEIHFVEQEIKRVQSFQLVELTGYRASNIPDRVFKNVDGEEIAPVDVHPASRVFLESGEATLKMYRVTGDGEKFIQTIMKASTEQEKKVIDDE